MGKTLVEFNFSNGTLIFKGIVAGQLNTSFESESD